MEKVVVPVAALVCVRAFVIATVELKPSVLLLVRVRELRGVVPPTAPVNRRALVPPSTVKALAPFSVSLKVTPAEQVMVLVPVMLVGNGNVSAAVVVMLLPTWIKLALVKVRLAKAVMPPTAPVSVMVPVPATKVRLSLAPPAVPYVVPVMVMFPTPAAP